MPVDPTHSPSASDTFTVEDNGLPAIDSEDLVVVRRTYGPAHWPFPVREALALRSSQNVGDAIDQLRRHADEEADHLHYTYVVDDAGCVAGVLSMRDVVLSNERVTLAEIMRRHVVTVADDADPHEVARLLRRHRYLAMPVVDRDARLVGIVTASDVMDAIEDEATADVLRLVGAGAEERLNSPWHYSFRMRIPWLLVSLLLAGLAASVIHFFEGTIVQWAVLAVYMPVVAGMGGNASAQAMAVTIRGIAVGDARHVSLRRVIKRELRVGVASGLVTGVAAGVIALVANSDEGAMLGGLIALSLFTNLVVGCLWGSCAPFLMRRLGFDPAQSATIFTTTVTDAVGFLTLLGLAAAMISVSFGR